MTIGVLAIQGDFDAHKKRLEELGAKVVLVRKPEQLDEIEGLVIPGGESGAFLKILGDQGVAKLKEFVRVRRNAYGRQIDSSIRTGKLGESPLEMVFIRAPKIERVGPGVEVIATEGNDPVVVREGKAMAATFHPELSQDRRVHQAFLDLVKNGHSPA